jgi:hypothetical protein
MANFMQNMSIASESQYPEVVSRNFAHFLRLVACIHLAHLRREDGMLTQVLHKQFGFLNDGVVGEWSRGRRERERGGSMGRELKEYCQRAVRSSSNLFRNGERQGTSHSASIECARTASGGVQNT